MSEEVRARAFEPFYATTEVGKGSGLGLAQVYGFARQSGGTAVIRSAAGQGTTVELYLPRSLALPERGERDRRSSTARSVLATTVLVVDDQDAVDDRSAAGF